MHYRTTCIYNLNSEIVRKLSAITAVEESDGRDSSVVRRPIEIVSNPRHNRGCTVRRPLNGMG